MREWFGLGDAISNSGKPSTKEKLTLSVDESVKERAKIYADKNSTSVSALVEAYLAKIVHEGEGAARPATDAEVAGISGQILTGRGGSLEMMPSYIGKAAYFDSGELLLDSSDLASSSIFTLRAKLRTRGLSIKSELIVRAEIIRSLNATKATEEAKGVREPGNDFLALVKSAAHKRATQMTVSVTPSEASVSYRIGGVVSTVRLPADVDAFELCKAAFNMSDTSSLTYRHLEMQSGRTTGTRVRLPDGLQSMSLEFYPTANSGRAMVCGFHYAKQSNIPVTTLSTLGFTDAQATAINSAASSRVGLILFAGWRDSGRRSSLDTALVQALTSRNGQALTIQVDNQPMSGSNAILQVNSSGSSSGEESRLRQEHAIASGIRAGADILAIGKISDQSVAKLAVQAASSGIQVWSTIDANNAASAVARLRLLVGHETLAAGGFPVTVVWQTLIPTPCPDCAKGPTNLSHETRARMQGWLGPLGEESVAVITPEGCGKCFSGTRGRSLIAEVVHFGVDAIACEAPAICETGCAGQHGADAVASGRADPSWAMSVFGK